MAFNAWSYTSPPFPSTLKLVPVSPPTELGPTQVLIQVAAAGLNPVDVQLANASIFRLPQVGAHPLRPPGAIADPAPHSLPTRRVRHFAADSTAPQRLTQL